MRKILTIRFLFFVAAILVLSALFYYFSVALWLVVPLLPLVFFLAFKDFNGPYATVIMNHGVSDRPEKYPLPQLVCHIELYDKFLAMLKRAGFDCLSIEEFYAYKSGSRKLKRKSVLLTFDDGYLDNWVFAAPLLKKYGVRGVMYASRDFIEKSDKVRKRFDEIGYDPKKAFKLECLNYCSERELQLMDQEGIIQVEAHAKSHSFYYSSNKIVGYYKQTEIDPFVEWNADLASKPFWMTSLERHVPVGTPIFEYDPSCGTITRYLPDPEAQRKISDYIQQVIQKKVTFDQRVVDDIMAEHPGCYETTDESEARFNAELVGVKKWLEDLLGRPVNYMAWPHGGITQKGIDLASQYYRLFQIPNSGLTNKPDDPVNQMSRIGGLGLRGTRFQQRMMILKIRSKMEIGSGNYYWILPFIFIKFLERLGIEIKDEFELPEYYHYNFKLIKS